MLNILLDPSNERKIVDFRPLGFRDVMVLGRFSYAAAHEPLEQHSHGDMIEIVYLDEGSQPYVSEGKEYLLRGGDVFVSLPREKHGSGPSPLGRGRLYWMLIHASPSRERFLGLPPSEGQELIKSFLDIRARQFKGRRLLKFYLENIFRAHDEVDAPMRTVQLKNWMLRFLLDVLDDSAIHEKKQISSPITRVQQFVDEHLCEQSPSLQELADMASLSLSRFKVRFKEEVGITPGNYITMRKVEQAKTQLLFPDPSITDVAFGLGFSSSQYFATAFKRYTGMTPQQYRRRGVD